MAYLEDQVKSVEHFERSLYLLAINAKRFFDNKQARRYVQNFRDIMGLTGFPELYKDTIKGRSGKKS